MRKLSNIGESINPEFVVNAILERVKGKKVMDVYLMGLLVVSILQSPLILVGTGLGIRSVFILSFLLIFLTMDLVLILAYIARIKFQKLEAILVLLIAISFVIGLVKTPDFTRRHITDFLMPFSFFLKIVIFRNVFGRFANVEYFARRYFPKYVIWTFLSGAILILGFYILVKFVPMYLGLTPNFYPFIFTELIKGSISKVCLGIVFIFFSGKRSMLLASFAVILFYLLFLKGNRWLNISIIVISLVLGSVAFSKVDLTQLTAFRKYRWSYKMIKEAKDVDLELIDLILGGRVAEFVGIVRVMSVNDYIIGKGVGFTYLLDSKSYGVEEHHASAHFTPLSIVSKYGIIFYMFLSVFTVRSLARAFRRDNKDDLVMRFFILYVVAVNIDFIFAYGVFTNKFYPIALAYMNKSNSHNINCSSIS